MRPYAGVLVAAIGVVLAYGSGAAEAAYTYGCTPVAVNTGSVIGVVLSVYNPNPATATIFRKLLNKDGVNQAETTDANNAPYPGEAAGHSIALLGSHTSIIKWFMLPGDPATTGLTQVVSVKIVSDLPVAVSAQWNPANSTGLSVPCTEIIA